MPIQHDWRFCGKCHCMFFDGGSCVGGGDHAAMGFNFALPHDVPPSDHAKKEWRFCGKCYSMFFDGFENKGRCAGGCCFDAIAFNFVYTHDVPPAVRN